MKKINGEREDLAGFLLWYRKIPHATTNKAPTMLLRKRISNSEIDLYQPSLRSKAEGK